MNKRAILFTAALLSTSGLSVVLPTTAVYADEINTDPGCDNPSAYMVDSHGGGTITVTGSKCVFSGVTAMKMLMQMNNKIKTNHRYHLEVDVSNYTAGTLRLGVGLYMPSATPGTYVTAAASPPIDDNFTTSSGLENIYHAKQTVGPGDSAEAGGAMRFDCNSGGWGNKDPMVYPGPQGSPHLHEFYGASNVGKSWTANDFRTKAESTCSNMFDASHAIIRTGYWIPAMLDGVGHAKRAAQITVYYKRSGRSDLVTSAIATGSISGTTMHITGITQGAIAKSLRVQGTGVDPATVVTAYGTGNGGTGDYTVSPSQTVASTTLTFPTNYTDGPTSDITTPCTLQTCVDVPANLRMTFGYKSSDGTCGPTDLTNDNAGNYCGVRQRSVFDCWGGPNGEGGSTGAPYTAVYRDLASLMNANVCVIGSWLHWGMDFPNCWDGINVDTPDHRAHVGYSHGALCDPSQPKVFPAISIQVFTRVDQAFLDHKWRLSSDEMATTCAGAAVTAGCTLHADYWEAWSPNVRSTFYQICIQDHNSCSREIGDGTGIKDGAMEYQTLAKQNGNGFQHARGDDREPVQSFGWTPDITANGHYSFDVTSQNDGVLELIGLEGASMSVDNFSVTELPTNAKGPVTVNGSN